MCVDIFIHCLWGQCSHSSCSSSLPNYAVFLVLGFEVLNVRIAALGVPGYLDQLYVLRRCRD